jgi:hypothetical protein
LEIFLTWWPQTTIYTRQEYLAQLVVCLFANHSSLSYTALSRTGFSLSCSWQLIPQSQHRRGQVSSRGSITGALPARVPFGAIRALSHRKLLVRACPGVHVRFGTSAAGDRDPGSACIFGRGELSSHARQKNGLMELLCLPRQRKNAEMVIGKSKSHATLL